MSDFTQLKGDPFTIAGAAFEHVWRRLDRRAHCINNLLPVFIDAW